MEVNLDLILSADTVEKLDTAIQFLESELLKGNGLAGFILANTYATGDLKMPEELKLHLKQDDEKATHYSIQGFNALSKQAESGNGEAMHLLALYYQGGMPPVACDPVQSIQWVQRSFDAGYLHAANDLYSHYCNPYSDTYNAEKATHYFKILEDAHMRCVTRYPWGEELYPNPWHKHP